MFQNSFSAHVLRKKQESCNFECLNYPLYLILSVVQPPILDKNVRLYTFCSHQANTKPIHSTKSWSAKTNSWLTKKSPLIIENSTCHPTSGSLPLEFFTCAWETRLLSAFNNPRISTKAPHFSMYNSVLFEVALYTLRYFHLKKHWFQCIFTTTIKFTDKNTYLTRKSGSFSKCSGFFYHVNSKNRWRKRITENLYICKQFSLT